MGWLAFTFWRAVAILSRNLARISGQQAHPDVEHRRGDLGVAVEGAKHQALLGQTAFRPGRDAVRHRAAGIEGQVAVGQAGHRLGAELLMLGRNDHAVRQDIIDEWGAHGSGIAEIVDLDRRRPPREDPGPVAHEVGQDMGAVPAMACHRLLPPPQILERGSQIGVIGGDIAIDGDRLAAAAPPCFHPAPAMGFPQGRFHGVSSRFVAHIYRMFGALLKKYGDGGGFLLSHR